MTSLSSSFSEKEFSADLNDDISEDGPSSTGSESSSFDLRHMERGTAGAEAVSAEDQSSGYGTDFSPGIESTASTTVDNTKSKATQENISWKIWILATLRFLGVWICLALTIVLGIQMGRGLSDRATQQAQDEFHAVVSEMTLAAEYRQQAMADALGTASLTVQTLAGEDWPFVTLGTDFETWTNRFALGATSITLAVLVQEDQRLLWSQYSAQALANWTGTSEAEILPYVWSGPGQNEDDSGLALVSWQTVPVDSTRVNYNWLGDPRFQPVLERMQATLETTQWSDPEMPESTYLLEPIVTKTIVEDGKTQSVLVGVLIAKVPWMSYLRQVDLQETPGLGWIVEDECDGHLVEVDMYNGRGGRRVTPDAFAQLQSRQPMFLDFPLLASSQSSRDCGPILHFFATPEWQVSTSLQHPGLAITTSFFALFLGSMVFWLYNIWVRRRQNKLANMAKKSQAIVNALFPATVRDRLLAKEETQDAAAANNRLPKKLSTVFQSMAQSIAPTDLEPTAMIGLPPSGRDRFSSKPIADLFPQVTVLFADIAGFTAWSSVREPSQVFVLLESVFEALDAIAKKHGIFKVETIGDCYVAAAGLPDPREDHAIAMSLFSRKAVTKVNQVMRSLETYSGPGTADLTMRFGLHSGPVMAGVLRGEKTRFQLFGDTMNTAARIEATGIKNKIHLSQQTAELLMDAGKEDWVEPRDTLVTAKGKGELKTYWLKTGGYNQKSGSHSHSSDEAPSSGKSLNDVDSSTKGKDAVLDNESVMSSTSSLGASTTFNSTHLDRLVNYNTQVLEGFLQRMLAMRKPSSPNALTNYDTVPLEPIQVSKTGSVLEEVCESITLPTQPAKYLQDPSSVKLGWLVKNQLREYVATIASRYRNVPFHCFDHASHVTMSVTKLLTRVVTPERIDYKNMSYMKKAGGSSALHEYTFGITSDPLTQFTVVLAALIHDVDHTGVPNTQLVKEGTDTATRYNGQSVAEQHSINLAWEILMEDKYADLRGCIYSTQMELDRFRSLLVNAVMATDIADKSLGALRRRRWNRVFGNADAVEEQEGKEDSAIEPDHDDTNRKATIVIEHLIQASDVSHTMQHWHVFLKWNQRLFDKMYLAYQMGRGDKDPSETWYQGELGFFDFYIIPLAKKLKECGVFGVSSDEYLNYAMANRREWEVKGKEIVQGYLADFERRVKDL